MITRAEFIQHWDVVEPRFAAAEPDSPLWIPEHDITEQCQWFVCVPPIQMFKLGFKQKYWSWCGENLQGETRCFTSDEENKQEWWGFTNEQDVAFWMLRWL